MAEAEEPGFLGRWARRKADARAGKPLAEPELANVADLAEPAEPAELDIAPAALANVPVVPSAADAAAQPPEPNPEPVLPTQDDVKSLTSSSDFKPFMARGVAPEVKNAAMKKLFADPHYNIMDGLDTYIDDYSKPDPIPDAMLRQMVSARFLKLFGDEDKEGGETEKTGGQLRDDAYKPDGQSVAQSYEDTDISAADSSTESSSQPDAAPALQHPASQSHHADTDLRLQPDHADPAQRAGRGAE